MKDLKRTICCCKIFNSRYLPKLKLYALMVTCIFLVFRQTYHRQPGRFENDNIIGEDNQEIKEISNTSKKRVRSTPIIGPCPIHPENEPNVEDLKKRLSLDDFELKFATPETGGWYVPQECKSDHKVAIIVPYRNRVDQLKKFVKWMQYFLQKQHLSFQIYIVEQEGNDPFNRAKLMNVGYNEAVKDRRYDCYIFHDVDLIPLNINNVYRCSTKPRHLTTSVDTLNNRLPYWEIFGGAVAMTEEHMKKINGFSNKFWGWGAEDDDISLRLEYEHLLLTRYPVEIGVYHMLHHKSEKTLKNLVQLSNVGDRYKTDGLNNLEYEVTRKIKEPLYTTILTNISKNYFEIYPEETNPTTHKNPLKKN